MQKDGARYELTESVEFNPGWTYEEYEANPTKYEIEFEKIREEAMYKAIRKKHINFFECKSYPVPNLFLMAVLNLQNQGTI